MWDEPVLYDPEPSPVLSPYAPNSPTTKPMSGRGMLGLVAFAVIVTGGFMFFAAHTLMAFNDTPAAPSNTPLAANNIVPAFTTGAALAPDPRPHRAMSATPNSRYQSP